MPARSVIAVPAPGRRPALYEQKADGFRRLVFARPESYLRSRRPGSASSAVII
ncbi:hypothetical protein ACFY71_28440 [Streptomyces cinerochromogenes]|uniref:hypothetical protein n=1 Tax=Streptomyces cinerochromogenes TaxID=66422 RepID=UPI003692FC8D